MNTQRVLVSYTQQFIIENPTPITVFDNRVRMFEVTCQRDLLRQLNCNKFIPNEVLNERFLPEACENLTEIAKNKVLQNNKIRACKKTVHWFIPEKAGIREVNRSDQGKTFVPGCRYSETLFK